MSLGLNLIAVRNGFVKVLLLDLLVFLHLIDLVLESCDFESEGLVLSAVHMVFIRQLLDVHGVLHLDVGNFTLVLLDVLKMHDL